MAQQHRDYRSGFSGSGSSGSDYSSRYSGDPRARYRGSSARGGFFDQEREEQDYDERSAGGYSGWEDPSEARWRGDSAYAESSRAPYDARDYGREETGYGRPYRGQYRDRPMSSGFSGPGRSSEYGDRYGSESRGSQYGRSGYGRGYYGDGGYDRDRDFYSQEPQRGGSRLGPGGYGSAEYSGGNSAGRFGSPSSYGYQGSSYGAQGQGGSERQSGFRGRGPKGYQRSDERLKEVICEQLTDDPRIDASEITVTVKNGEVTLEGTVNDRSSKYRAEDLVDDCSGVREIHNRLRVQSPESSGLGQSWDSASSQSSSGSNTGRDTGMSSRSRSGTTTSSSTTAGQTTQ